MLIEKTVHDFLNETASSSAAPGGGSVSALAASLAAALTSMVCHLTIGKKKYADVEDAMKDVLGKSEAMRMRMQQIIDEDTNAFDEVMKAFGLPKESDDDKASRAEAIQRATKKATLVPLGLVRACAELAGLVESVARCGNRNSRSDAGVAALMLSAAVRGAAMNVYINLGGIDDQEFVKDVRKECEGTETAVTERCEAIAREVRSALMG